MKERLLVFFAFVLFIMGPEVWRLFPNAAEPWVIYGCAQQLVFSAMCVMMYSGQATKHPIHVGGAAVWFITQAAQEAEGKNEGITDTWEYSLLGAYFVWILIETLRPRK